MSTIAKIIMTMVLAGLLGCSVEPSKVSNDNAEDMGAKITYFRDSRTGICFAMVRIELSQGGLGLTQVDCGACASLLVN